MLSQKLLQVREDIQKKIFKSEDEKKTLLILELIERDSRLGHLETDKNPIIKSFAVSSDICPTCGKANSYF